MLEAEDDAILAIESNVGHRPTVVGFSPGGTIEAASGGTVKLSAEVADGVSGSSVSGQVVIAGGVFEMLAGASVSVPIEFTAAGTLEILDVATVSLSGSNGAITAISGDKISLTSGTGDTITGAGFTVTAATGTAFTVGGNGVSGVNDVVNGVSERNVGTRSQFAHDGGGSSDTITVARAPTSPSRLDQRHHGDRGRQYLALPAGPATRSPGRASPSPRRAEQSSRSAATA